MIVISIDTETTGVDKTKDGIIQVAATSGGHVLLSTLCETDSELNEDSIKVHGITKDRLLGQPHELEVLSELCVLLESYGGPNNVILAGFNHEKFDLPLMNRICSDCGFAGYRTLDLFTYALRNAQHHEGKMTLTSTYTAVTGREPKNAHDAAGDCLMVDELISTLLSSKFNSLKQLYDYLAQPVVLDIWPLGKHKGKETSKVPKHYLRWCQQNFEDPHKDLKATFVKYL